MKFKPLVLILCPLIGVLIGISPGTATSPNATSPKAIPSNVAVAKPPAQTIAMQPELNAAPSDSTPDIRWLGYGLFLLQIGWIPLQFVKVQPIRLDD